METLFKANWQQMKFTVSGKEHKEKKIHYLWKTEQNQNLVSWKTNQNGRNLWKRKTRRIYSLWKTITNQHFLENKTNKIPYSLETKQANSTLQKKGRKKWTHPTHTQNHQKNNKIYRYIVGNLPISGLSVCRYVCW